MYKKTFLDNPPNLNKGFFPIGFLHRRNDNAGLRCGMDKFHLAALGLNNQTYVGDGVFTGGLEENKVAFLNVLKGNKNSFGCHIAGNSWQSDIFGFKGSENQPGTIHPGLRGAAEFVARSLKSFCEINNVVARFLGFYGFNFFDIANFLGFAGC